MKRLLMGMIFACALTFTGCIAGCNTTKPNVPVVQAPVEQVWWGNKQEIKDYLDSEKATSERWFIQGIR
jgi:hypothetical protein